MPNHRSFVLSATVVLAVFSLLLIAFYTYTIRQRENVRSRRCLSTLKCVASSLKMYCDDYCGQLPSSYLVSHSKRWDARDSALFCTGAGWGWNGVALPRLPRTWPVLLSSGHPSMCPPFCASERPADPARQHVSYYYKLANDKAWYGIGCDAPRRLMSDYAYESDQIAFYERLGWHCRDTSGLKNRVKINVSYIDTHVATITLKNSTSGDPVNCAANSNGEPMYYNTLLNEYGETSKRDRGPATHTDPTRSCDSF